MPQNAAGGNAASGRGASGRFAPGGTRASLFEMTRNGLDALRLLAALMVMWGHAFALHGDGVGYEVHAERAGVGIFFLISGCLVTQSWVRDPSLLRFAARRALRIMPALVVVVVLTAFVLGPFVTSLPAGAYLRDGWTWAYLRWAVLIPGSFHLPGVFPNNPGESVADGSLRTLPLEAICYALVAVAGLLRGRAPVAMLAVLLIASWGCYEGGGMVLAMVAVFAGGALLAAFGIRLWYRFPHFPLMSRMAFISMPIRYSRSSSWSCPDTARWRVWAWRCRSYLLWPCCPGDWSRSRRCD